METSKSILLAVFAAIALAGCQAMGTTGTVLAFTDAGDRFGGLVNEYCTADQNERELFRARVAAATGPNKLTVECAGDGSEAGTRDTVSQ